ncbi:MAG TPA: hypothetical protein VGJ00_07035 [Rhabdochlamydiaceae bacterium]
MSKRAAKYVGWSLDCVAAIKEMASRQPIFVIGTTGDRRFKGKANISHHVDILDMHKKNQLTHIVFNLTLQESGDTRTHHAYPLHRVSRRNLTDSSQMAIRIGKGSLAGALVRSSFCSQKSSLPSKYT